WDGEFDCAEPNAYRAVLEGDALVHQSPASVPAKRALAYAYGHLAFVRARQNAHREAADLYKQQQSLFDDLDARGSDALTQYERAFSGVGVGEALLRAGDFSGAVPSLEQSAEVLEDLARSHPEDTKPRVLLSDVYALMARSEGSLRRDAAADGDFRRADEILSGLVKADRQNANLRSRLTELYGIWGEWRISSERPREGLVLARKARDLAAELSAMDAEDREARSQVARMTSDIGWASEVLARNVRRPERRKAL